METKNKNTQGFNTSCEKFKESLINLINGSGLPIGAVYYITRHIMNEIESTYYAVINSEAIEQKEE